MNMRAAQLRPLPIMRAMKFPLTFLFALLAACMLAGCDYPEAGFYEITAVDKGKTVGAFPFMIEELTDDTDLTIGFNIMLPRRGELVAVKMENGRDFSKRSWDVRLGQGDSGYGDLQLELVHAADTLSFNGARRDPEAGQSEMFRGQDIMEFAGKVVTNAGDPAHPAEITFDGVLPGTLLSGRANEAKWTLRRISQAAFEKALGAKVAEATRREAPYLASFRPERPQNERSPKPATTVRPGRYKRNTPGGERKVGP
jgi:hypothetical protein